MSPVAPDARDLDDTVALPPCRRAGPLAGMAQPEPDLDDTITIVRGGAPCVPATAPAVQPDRPYVRPAKPEFSGNIWAEPLPEAPRPFRLKLADGSIAPLDQPVYLGRRPSVPRIHPGGVPLLVALDSPEREVSSTHLELSTVGGAIVASDMRSTNGSVLRVPGSEPRILIGGESAVVTAGTIIELGDGNLIELLAPEQDDEEPAAEGAGS